MGEIENSTLAIIGAGAVGTSLAYAALIRQSAREVVLYDIATDKVAAEVLDLSHGTQFTGSSRIRGGSDIDAIAGAQVVVVTAGAKQHPGQSRLDLAAVNARMLDDLMPQLIQRAPDAIYLIVSNPCDVLAVVAHRSSGLPASQLFASGTVLDSSRLRVLLADRLSVSPTSVHAMIVGEHGDSEFPLWSQARIGPVPILEWQPHDRPPVTLDELTDIADTIKNAAYRVIAGKGVTNFAIGLAGARIVEAVLRDESVVLPVSSVMRDYHGISGVAMSMPSVVGRTGVSSVIDVELTPPEEAALHRSADAITRSLAALGA